LYFQTFSPHFFKMQTEILADYTALSRRAADIVVDLVQKNPRAVLCLASGSSPMGTFACLADDVRAGRADFSEVTFVGLDEWVGMDRHQAGSCQALLYDALFGPLNIRPEQIVYFDAKASDLAQECARLNDFVADQGGLDLMLVGMGLNGHIALNEPGTPFDSWAHVSELAETTKLVANQKYFDQPTPLSQGITLGLGHFAQARLPILLVSGRAKASMVQQALQGPSQPDCPASIVQQIAQARVLLDTEAASEWHIS
jgi:glucosamine-6-phosphate isomerase